MDLRLLQRIEEKKRLLDARRPLPHSILEKLHENIAIEWIYNSNAIEGNTLTLKETALVLREGMTIKGKSLREHFEVKNHEKAILFLEKIIQKKQPLSEKLIMDVHALVLQNIEEEFSGRYRPGQVRIVGANFTPPNALKVPKLMAGLFRWMQKDAESLHIVQLAAHAHHQFVWIHPFIDGNGRTGRLLMNLLLMQQGYPPAVILKNDRKKYYDGLNQANNGEYEKIELLIGQAVERSLDLYLDACGASFSEEYVSLRLLAEEFHLSQEYLSLLARRGKIDAWKERRNWLSSRSGVEKYLKSVGRL
jgi:Fic family protein